MGQLDDYFPRVSTVQLKDRDIEMLLSGESTGSGDLADLERFVAAFATEVEPPRDTAHMATALAARARSSASRPVRSVFRRLVVLSACFAVVLAFSGVAMAADGASPGDFLYDLDRALESVGLGSGGIDERIDEFEVLLDRGSREEAFEFLEAEMKSSSSAEAAIAVEHITAAKGTDAVGPVGTSGPTATPADPVLEIPTTPTTTNSRPDDEASTEVSPGTGSQDDDSSAGNDNPPGHDEKSPPGLVKEDESKAEPETAGPKEGSGAASPDDGASPSNQGGNSDPGANGNQTDPGNNGNTDPGSPRGSAGQNEGQGQGQGQGQNQGQGQGQNQGQGQDQG